MAKQKRQQGTERAANEQVYQTINDQQSPTAERHHGISFWPLESIRVSIELAKQLLRDGAKLGRWKLGFSKFRVWRTPITNYFYQLLLTF